jgi:pimeloyl-ACP methyl ester carboxylesterase
MMISPTATVFSPPIEQAGRAALDQFLTPPPARFLSAPEQVLLDQATLLSVPFDDININAFYWGEGPTVMLVHGWGGCGLQLSEFIQPLLNAGYRVLAFDAPAHGSTEGIQTNGFELAQAIATVANYYTAKLHQSIHSIIAHSLGATSTTLALSKGLQTNRVVYLGAVCWLSNVLTVFAKRAKFSDQIETALRHFFLEKFGQDVWLRYGVEETALNLKIPVALFHDLRDREVAFTESEAIARIWDGAKLIKTEGLGHRRILRDEQVIQQAVDFISNSRVLRSMDQNSYIA